MHAVGWVVIDWFIDPAPPEYWVNFPRDIFTKAAKSFKIVG
jgi:hypothetical protein